MAEYTSNTIKIPSRIIRNDQRTCKKAEDAKLGLLQFANDNRLLNIIQRRGERTAVKSTYGSGQEGRIKRGNRKKSVDETQGMSMAKLGDGETAKKNAIGYRNKKEELKSFVLLKMREKKSMAEAIEIYDNNITYIQAEVIKRIMVGNCEEFSTVVFAHLVQNTTDQWVYFASLDKEKGFDHAFVFTYNTEIAGNGVETIDKDKAIVADAWDGYIVNTLRGFMEGENPYEKRLVDSNIKIMKKAKAVGHSMLCADIIKDIEQWTTGFNSEVEHDRQGLYKKTAEECRKIEHVEDEVNDLQDFRTLEQQISNCTDEEKTEIVNELLQNTNFFNEYDALSRDSKLEILHLLPVDKLLEIYYKYKNTIGPEIIPFILKISDEKLFEKISTVNGEKALNILCFFSIERLIRMYFYLQVKNEDEYIYWEDVFNSLNENLLFKEIEKIDIDMKIRVLNHLVIGKLVKYVNLCRYRSSLKNFICFCCSNSYPYKVDILSRINKSKRQEILNRLNKGDKVRLKNEMQKEGVLNTDEEEMNLLHI